MLQMNYTELGEMSQINMSSMNQLHGSLTTLIPSRLQPMKHHKEISIEAEVILNSHNTVAIHTKYNHTTIYMVAF